MTRGPNEPPVEPFRADLLHRKALRDSAVRRGLLAASVGLVMLIGAGVAHFWSANLKDLPEIPANARAMADLGREPGVTVLDRQGQVIAERGARFGTRVALSDLPPWVPDAFLAAEDRRFYQHGGLDWQAVGRATMVNLRAGRSVEGASTLTQQLARNLFLSRERTFKRKVQEAILAIRLEHALSKDQILELYLNRVYLGEGAYGVDAAARAYFGKPARALTPAEAAVLAALPKAPSLINPVRDEAAALRRARLVLTRMKAEGWIDDARYRLALRQRLTLAQPREKGDFGWIADMAARAAREAVDKNARSLGRDLIVQTTLDPGLQASAARTLRDTLRSRPETRGAQGAIVVLGREGEILALVGGRRWTPGGFNRATQARRQPGSAFKPFVFAAALDAGVGPDASIDATPVAFGPRTVSDAGSGGAASLTLTQAMARSSNAVAVRLAREAGPERVARLAERFGLDPLPRRPGLSVALGAYETSPLKLAAGYQTFQTGGLATPPVLVTEVASTGGEVLWRAPRRERARVYDPLRAAEVTRMMSAVIASGTGRSADFGRPAAGKTGTSQGGRDAWFAGFTPERVAVVWVGRDDNAAVEGLEGGGASAEIWRRVMQTAHARLPGGGFEAAPDDAAEAARAERLRLFYDDLAAAFARTAALEGAR